MLAVGFSTGALAFSDFERALQLLEGTSASVVELSALRAAELPVLLEALQPLLTRIRPRYKYISFHAPTNFNDERHTVQQLEKVAALNLNIVVHPDTIQNAEVWRPLGGLLCLENLDSRRRTGRTAEELHGFFAALPEAKLCFDIAHARQVDPTMTEAARILSKFGDRLAQVHVSELNSQGKHFRLSFAAKLAYRPFSSILSEVPIVLESVVGETDIAAELREAEEVFALDPGLQAHRKELA
jgi:hypothetical protein